MLKLNNDPSCDYSCWLPCFPLGPWGGPRDPEIGAGLAGGSHVSSALGRRDGSVSLLPTSPSATSSKQLAPAADSLFNLHLPVHLHSFNTLLRYPLSISSLFTSNYTYTTHLAPTDTLLPVLTFDMRLSPIAAAALALAPEAVSAAGTLGFSLGTKKTDGSCKAQSDYEADYEAIFNASGSKLVRGYSASDCNAAQYMLPAAKAKGFKVVLGVWCVCPTIQRKTLKLTAAGPTSKSLSTPTRRRCQSTQPTNTRISSMP